MEAFPDPSQVGKAFVRQYYTQMHKNPSIMHRFYLDKSSFVYGGSEMGSEQPILGQKAIHDKIMSLDLQQVHAKIKQVDSYSTLGNGIVVQVTGELSVRGHPMRAFVQTFVLGQDTPKKYYVHNDIFRYQDDDLISESETNENPEEGGEATPQPLMNVGEFTTIGGDNDVEQYEVQPVEPMSDPKESADWNQFTDLPVTENGLDTPPVGDFPTANEPIETELPEETFSPADIAEPENKGASTWASRLAPKPSGNRPLNSTAIPTSQALPQRDPRPNPRRQTDNNRSSQTQQSNNPTGGFKDNKKTPSVQSPDNCQIFVGGLPPSTQDTDIRKVFEVYGAVRDVRISSKNFAFVVFESPSIVNKVMSLKEPPSIRGKTLNVELKRSNNRPRGDRDGQRGDRDGQRGDREGQRGDRERPRGVGGGKPRGGKPPPKR